MLVAELVGFVLLCFRWVPEMGWTTGSFYALFSRLYLHSITQVSRCSQTAWWVLLMIHWWLYLAGLFIFGGLGFTVVGDLSSNWRSASSTCICTLRSCWIATPTLLLVGRMFLLLERNNSATMGRPLYTRSVVSCIFPIGECSCSRGFNSVDLSQYTQPALLVMIVPMLIGAGSTHRWWY